MAFVYTINSKIPFYDPSLINENINENKNENINENKDEHLIIQLTIERPVANFQEWVHSLEFDLI